MPAARKRKSKPLDMFNPPPAPPKEAEIEDVAAVIPAPKARLEMARLVIKRVSLSDQVKILNGPKGSTSLDCLSGLNYRIKTIIGEFDAPLFLVNGNRVNYFSSDRESCKVAALRIALSEFVDTETATKIIKKCVKSKTVDTLKITPPSGVDEDEDDE